MLFSKEFPKTSGPVEAGLLERTMAMKKDTFEKITTWFCGAILAIGVGYAWCYHHWTTWAAAKGLTL